MPDGSIVDLQQVRQRLDAAILIGMIVPAGTNGNIGLGRVPERDTLAAVPVVPNCVRSDTGFIADPVDRIERVAGTVREDHGVRSQCVDRRKDASPVIGLLFAVRPFAVRTVQPDFGHIAVARQQLLHLADIVGIVGLPWP